MKRLLAIDTIGPGRVCCYASAVVSEAAIVECIPAAKAVAKKLGRIVPEMTDDLIGVAMLALVRAGRTFDPGLGVPFSGYVAVMARYACLESLRAKNRKMLDRVELKVYNHPRTESRAAATELSLDLHAAMGALPPRLRGIIQQHYFREVPIGVLAKRRRVGSPALSLAHRDALRRMRKSMTEKTVSYACYPPDPSAEAGSVYSPAGA